MFHNVPIDSVRMAIVGTPPHYIVNMSMNFNDVITMILVMIMITGTNDNIGQ